MVGKSQFSGVLLKFTRYLKHRLLIHQNPMAMTSCLVNW